MDARRIEPAGRAADRTRRRRNQSAKIVLVPEAGCARVCGRGEAAAHESAGVRALERRAGRDRDADHAQRASGSGRERVLADAGPRRRQRAPRRREGFHGGARARTRGAGAGNGRFERKRRRRDVT